MATLVATEEYPIKASVTPKPSAPVVIKSNKLASGIQSVSRESSSPVRFSESFAISRRHAVFIVCTQFVALKVAVVGGSSAEGKNAKGAAHFLSKAAFAGSGSHSGLSLVHALESLGANIHAYADKEKVYYGCFALSWDEAPYSKHRLTHPICPTIRSFTT
jgi:predicted Zn-dependent peptidase